MLENGKSVQSLWLGGERFDKYSQDDEDALAKYKKMESFIGTTVHVSTNDDITDLTIRAGTQYQGFTPFPHQDEDVNIDAIRWDGGDSVDLIGWLDVQYGTDMFYNDLCIVGSEDI